MPEDAVLGVRAPLTGYASLKQMVLHDFQFILSEAVGGSNIFRSQLFSKQILLPLFTRCIDELNLLSASRALSYLRSSQFQAAKFRIEKDSRRS